jgi:hypothetical protein
MSICKYIYPKNTSTDYHGRTLYTAGAYAYYYNNTIEEIEIINSNDINQSTYLGYQNPRNDFDLSSYKGNQNKRNDFYINVDEKYYTYNDEVENYNNSSIDINNLHLPKLNKIKIDVIKTGYNFDLILTIIKHCINLKSLIINKIDLSDKKINLETSLLKYGKILSEIREYCEKNNIKLEIGEIIYN